MRTLERNKRHFYYAPFIEKTPIVDEQGYMTGEYSMAYGNPVCVSANVSSAKGETATMLFGESEDYDKVITLSDTEIDEYSILWVDVIPVIEDGVTDTPYDYIVKKVARSLNSVSIAIRKVKVGE